jgi:uncharacterized SAM-binding protein YcdF (DUF218 family)
MKRIACGALSLALAALSVYYAAVTNFNFGNLCVWALTAACILYTVFCRRIDAFLTGTAPGRVLLALLAAGCAFFLFVLGVILRGQSARRASGQEPVLIVLGCAVHGDAPSRLLTCRLEAAWDFYEENPQATLVVCGGQGPGETRAEAAVMRDWLVRRGIPAEHILLDDASTSTEENFENARRLLAARGISAGEPAAFVTNGFHCWRAARYAAQAGFSDARAVPAAIPAAQLLPCYLREVFAVVYYWAFKSPDRGLMHRFVGFLCVG